MEGLAYQFANGEGRLTGGLNGRTQGGNRIGGTLILVGEAMVEFHHAGAARRVLWLDGDHWPPLGKDTIGQQGTPAFIEGQRRAAMLQEAWEAGAGLFGKAVMEVVWGDWPRVAADIRQWAQAPVLRPLGPWAEPLAAAFVVLGYAYTVALVPVVPLPDLLDAWSQMLTDGHRASDPATEAWERLITMMTQAEKDFSGPAVTGWNTARLGREPVAYQRSGENIWRIPTQTPQFKERVGLGKKDVVRLHGQTWVQRGWVIPDSEGTATNYEAIPDSKVRVLLVPEDQLTNWNP
jgi:hypothetical protein